MWRKSTLQHFDLGAVISSLLKTAPPPSPSPSPFPLPPSSFLIPLSLIVIVQATLVVLMEEGELSGVMILLRRGRSAAKCSSATHYSYHFYPLRKVEGRTYWNMEKRWRFPLSSITALLAERETVALFVNIFLLITQF